MTGDAVPLDGKVPSGDPVLCVVNVDRLVVPVEDFLRFLAMTYGDVDCIVSFGDNDPHPNRVLIEWT